MSRIPMVDLAAQYASIQPEIEAAMQRVLRHQQFILGPEVAAFEEAFADYLGAVGAVGVSSGTAALRLALEACGVGPGDRVITTAMSFIATAEAISHLGATPLFVDIDPVTYTLCPERVSAALEAPGAGGPIKAILPVHLYGHPAKMDRLVSLATEHGIHTIEDAAQAHGAELGGRRCGTLGSLGCFSFYPSKNLGAYGDAGGVTGTDAELLARVRRLRDHGRTSRYDHREVGWNERMDGLQGAVLGVKLAYLERWTEARRENAHRLTELLADIPQVQTPVERPETRHVYHLYTIRAEQRDALRAHLEEAGIAARVHNATPLHCQPAYAEACGTQSDLPRTCRAAEEVISLPMFPELSQAQLEQIAEAVRSFYCS